MYNWIYELLDRLGLDRYAWLAAYIVSFVAVLLICILLRYAIRLIITRAAAGIGKKTKNKWDAILLKNKVFHRISDLSFPFILSIYLGALPEQNAALAMLLDVAAIIIVILIINAVIRSADEIYRGLAISKVRPLRSIFQVIRAVICIIGGIVVIATLIGESPMVLIGGISAMTAVTSIVFKDPILGFVAGIQLTSNDMIRIGDWIEVPKYSADGTIVDLTMTTVKVQNFDNTITSIPAYTLVSDSFINWRGMTNSGGRRIKREIYIDVSGIRLCNTEMLGQLEKLGLIKDLLNEERGSLTNIGMFRAYISEYLKRHPGIRGDMIIMVRQLSAEGSGVPLEIYAFTNTTDWQKYEDIQSDIFEHLYSVVKEFGLSVYQRPSGNDIRELGPK